MYCKGTKKYSYNTGVVAYLRYAEDGIVGGIEPPVVHHEPVYMLSGLLRRSSSQ